MPGGRERFLAAVEVAVQHKDPYAVAWWTVFASLSPTERQRASLDDICLACDVPAEVLMGIVVQVAMRHGHDVANLISAVMRPEVMQATVKYALQRTGTEDRRMLHQASGFLPTSKGGPNISITNSAQAAARADGPASNDDGAPSFLRDVESVRHLPEHVDATPVEAEIVEPVEQGAE